MNLSQSKRVRLLEEKLDEQLTFQIASTSGAETLYFLAKAIKELNQAYSK